jgi:uncharacterized membrane protein YbhN (UPF0104 family)
MGHESDRTHLLTAFTANPAGRGRVGTEPAPELHIPDPVVTPAIGDTLHIKFSCPPDDAAAVNLRTGWTPRILGAVLLVFAGWFVVSHSSDFLPALGKLVSLGPTALPVGLALVALGVLNRGLQAQASFRLVELDAPFAPLVKVSAMSYATNKVVKSAGASGLVPYLAHADRVGNTRARTTAAYLSGKVAETISLCLLVAVAVTAGAATGSLHGGALYGAVGSAVYAIVVGVGLVLIASRRSLVVTIAARSRQLRARVRRRFGHPERDVDGCAGHELACAMARLRADWRATTALLGTAVFGKLIGCAALYLVLAGLGIHLGFATTLLVYTLTIMAALIGPLPGGVGVADASLAALLIANGAPAAAAAGAVIAFRLLDLWLPLFVGAVAGAHHWRRRDVEVSPAPAPAETTVPVAMAMAGAD